MQAPLTMAPPGTPGLLGGTLGMIKQGGVLALGHVGAQGLLILASPLLTRLFTPADLGTFGIILAIVGVPAAVANANFDQAIVLPRNNRTAAHMAALAAAAALALSLLAWAIAFGGQSWLDARGLGDLLWFAAPWLLGYGLFRAFDQWAIRGEHFGRSGAAHALRTAAMVMIQCVGGFFGASPAILLTGQLVGQWVGALFLARGFRRWLTTGWLRVARLRVLVRKYRAFPMFGSPQVVVNDFATQAPIFLFGLLLGPAAAGQYWLAYRAIIAPSSLFERSLRAAFYRRLAGKAQRHDGFFADVVLLTSMLAAAGLAPVVAIVAFGPEIFAFVFGADWAIAGEYSRWLVVWWFCGLINLPCTAAIPILGLQRAFLTYEVAYAVIRLTGLALGSLAGPIGAVAAFTIVAVMFNLSLIGYVHAVLWQRGSGSAVAEAARTDVAFFLPSLAGNGAERIVLLIAGELARRGVRIDLVVARWEGELTDRVPGGVRPIDLGAKRMMAAVLPLIRYLRQARPRVLMPTITAANVVALLAGRLAAVPSRIVVRQAAHLHASRMTADQAKSRLIAWIAEWTYRMADGAVAISKGVGDDLVANAGVEPGRLRVIHNPVDVAAVERAAADGAPHHWFAEDVPVILSVGRLTYQKDIATLLRAFARVRATRRVRLLVLGEGEDRADLVLLASRLGIADDVDLPGYAANPYPSMARARVFVLSSRWEGFGNVLVEALACGLPVVSTDCPSGPREILQDGAFGMLVPVGDDEAMAAAITAALDHPPVAARQRARAASFALAPAVERYAEALGLVLPTAVKVP